MYFVRVGIDYWKVILLLSGVVLFLLAPKISHNTLFYYICGVSLGICASFLVLIYFASKIFPKVIKRNNVKYCHF